VYRTRDLPTLHQCATTLLFLVLLQISFKFPDNMDSQLPHSWVWLYRKWFLLKYQVWIRHHSGPRIYTYNSCFLFIIEANCAL
jgi:hypothetical protein